MSKSLLILSLASFIPVQAGCPADGEAPVDADLGVDTAPPDTNDTAPPVDADATSPPDTPDAVSPPDISDTSEVDADTTEPPSEVMRVHVLDVGQGEAILIELPCGAMLIDTGGEVTPASADAPAFDSVDALDNQLRAFFAGRPDLDQTLDLVVLTHPHIDHTRGVTRLIEMVSDGELVIGNIVTNGAEGSGSGVVQQRDLHDFADAQTIPRWYVLERKARPDGLSNDIIDPFPACSRTPGATPIDPKVTALWGRIDDASDLTSTWRADDLDNQNNHSVVLRVDFGLASALFPGDLESPGIGELIRTFWSTDLLDVDLYKAGHHGSYNGTTAALISTMSPEVAVISAGPAHRTGPWTAWSFGLPRWAAVSDMLGDTDSPGVALDRPTAITVPIGASWNGEHGVFVDRPIGPAVFCTGWDGTIGVTLSADGDMVLPD